MRLFLRAMAGLFVCAVFLTIPVEAAAKVRASVRILDEKGVVQTFHVVVAQTEAEKRRGLMFVKSLPPQSGMLFLFAPPRPTAFWMKNTVIPLDILFIDAQNRIVKIVENAKPLDETPLPSVHAVAAVLEIPGGTAKRTRIVLGDRVERKDQLPR